MSWEACPPSENEHTWQKGRRKNASSGLRKSREQLRNFLCVPPQSRGGGVKVIEDDRAGRICFHLCSAGFELKDDRRGVD